MIGKVTLVSAGIGRVGLMTLDSINALKNADVVVYDRLLGEGVSELIPENAEKINAGKETSKHTIPQSEINNILISKAKEGKNVVRLKGGDSYVFGRGGEEAEALYRTNIPFSVISGVTSAIAAPAYAGIPVTHRDCSSSLHIITGHHKNDNALNINFKAYAEIGGTLVFLMGVKNLEYITNGLINAGMKGNTPCAIVENGASPMQRKVISSLRDISLKAADFKSPSVIVVGDVCRYSDSLDWYSRLPLKGKKIIITRPFDRAKNMANMLREQGALVDILPCISTESLNTEICEDIEKSETILFTSPTGVKTAFDIIYKNKRDARIFGGKHIGAVGGKTGAELLKYGISADIVPKEHSGIALADEICKNNLDNILILRAEKGAEGITEYFKSKNKAFTDKAVYRTNIINVKADNADYVVFASPSEVKGFSENEKNYIGVCIGKTTLAEAEKQGIKAILSETTDDEGIVKAIIKNNKESI